MFIPLPILFLLVSLLIVGWLFFFECNRQFWKLLEESHKFVDVVRKWRSDAE